MRIEALTPDRWDDLADLFGPNGACGGCWCMWWRVSAEEFKAGNDANRERFRAVVATAEHAPGLLAYDDEGRPVGWAAVAPRRDFGRIERSRDLVDPAEDGPPPWSVNCFYIRAGHRGQGIGSALLDAAVAFAAERGAEVVEGYAVDPTRRTFSNSEAYTGTVAMFEAAGFAEAFRRKPTSRVVMRRRVDGPARASGGRRGS